MLDDSWDSASSPDVKKKTYGGGGNKNQKQDSKYNFPAPSNNKNKYNDDSFDKDAMFSPTNSQGSPDGTPRDYKNRSYNFDDSPSKDANADYLANFVTESADLEDSILGELLGGGKKATKPASRPTISKSRSPQPNKLEPIDTMDSPEKIPAGVASKSQKSKPSPRRALSPAKSFKSSNYRSTSPPSTGEMSRHNSESNFDDDAGDFPISPAFGVKRQTSAESTGGAPFGAKRNPPAAQSSFDAAYSAGGLGRRHAQPSFDATHDHDFLNEINKSNEEDQKLASVPAIKKFTDGLVRPKTSAGVAEHLPPAEKAPEKATALSSEYVAEGTSGKSAGKEDGGDTAGLAFIPSFMEPGRQTRRRRQLDTSPSGRGFGDNDFGNTSPGGAGGSGPLSAKGSMPKLNDLDIALGLGGTTTQAKKAAIDPFSAVDKKIPQLEKQASATFQMDSDDSSSDDALLNRARYGRKDSFNVVTKPATGTTGATTAGGAIGQASKSVSKDASTTFGAASAFPPSTAGASAATAPARVSTFTPAKQSSLSSLESNAAGNNNANGAGMKMSDSFENLSTLNVRSPTSPAGGQASLASLPIISPSHSFRASSNSAPPTIAKPSAHESNNNNNKKAYDDADEVDDLDISGIVRIDLDDDLLIPRSNRHSTLHKSPSNATARPKTASRSPRASFADAAGLDAQSARNSISGTARGPGGAMGDTSLASGNASLSIRTNSPAGMLTSAINNFDQSENAPHSRRNSATSSSTISAGIGSSGLGVGGGGPGGGVLYNSPVVQATKTAATFQEGLVRDRSQQPAPSSHIPAYQAPVPAESTTFGYAARRTGRDEPPAYADMRPLQIDTREDTRHAPSTQQALAASAATEQHIIQQMNAEKSELESKLLQEIEVLKVKLTHPQPASFQHSKLEVSSEEREHYRLLQDNNIKYIQEVIDQKRLIAHLESEISRLKDEAIIKAQRSQEEMVWLKEKYESEIKDVKIKNSIETESMERRQEDALSSLRKLHAHEIESIKERYKSEDKFELIAGQLRSTSGSIQFIEQQLQTRQRGVEAIREGQIDARERLLAEMEEKARERAEIAEAEGYRLKGILSHMEHVVSSLREQGSEEKERLRQEHSRLQSRQTAFEAERNALQTRNLEELAYIKQRSREVELELAKLTQEKQHQYEGLSAAQNKLDSERADFTAFAAASKRALEQSEARLREEEARIMRLRNEMILEKNALDDRRTLATRDIEGAEELKNVLVRAQKDNEAEKEELRRISQSYKAASEELMQQERELQEQQEALEERELALREGFAQMKLAATELSQREGAIKDSVQYLDRKRVALDKADRETMEHRLVSAASFREWSARQNTEYAGPPPPTYTRSAWTDARDGDQGGRSAEDLFSKYDVFGSGQNINVRGSAEDPFFRSRNGETGRMSKSAEFDSGFDTRGGGANGGFSGRQPARSVIDKENLYGQILQQQQQERPWIESFQDNLKKAFQNGASVSGSAGAAGASMGGGYGAQERLPVELRNAQASLRQSRGQLARAQSSSLQTQKMLRDEEDFLSALSKKRTVPGSN